ncbi:MAG: Gfo/Idh/MocA family oxidoreductase [Spirochaetales bacterium]|nr:Gfo/Idh/MocA family oxidoreductase [Spirochaetales bacterium]
MKPIKCSIVGLGRIGSLLEDDPLREKPATHAGAITANPRCRLVSGCDIDVERCKRFSKRWNCPHVFSDFHSMLSHTVPDILCIATPPHTHRDIVCAAVQYGVPLLICEKPLTENIGEAGEIIKNVSSSGTILMVNHERRYSLDYLHLKKIIDKKMYGELFSLNCKLYMGKGRTVREMLWEDGTHMIDIIRFLTDREITRFRVTGNLFKKNGECIIVLDMGPVYAVIDAACNRDHLVFELDVGFTKGMVKIGNGVYEEYESRVSPFYKKFRSLMKKKARLFTGTNYFSGMLEDAVRVLQYKKQKEHPVSSGIDGYYAVKAISAIINEKRE